jgi:hypothetical protein
MVDSESKKQNLENKKEPQTNEPFHSNISELEFYRLFLEEEKELRDELNTATDKYNTSIYLMRKTLNDIDFLIHQINSFKTKKFNIEYLKSENGSLTFLPKKRHTGFKTNRERAQYNPEKILTKKCSLEEKENKLEEISKEAKTPENSLQLSTITEEEFYETIFNQKNTIRENLNIYTENYSSTQYSIIKTFEDMNFMMDQIENYKTKGFKIEYFFKNGKFSFSVEENDFGFKTDQKKNN